MGLAQELPPILNYSSKDYGAENQNWDISQSNEKYIYVANNSGLLEFNGAKWNLYPSPNSSVIRSVKVVGDKIFTGCFREFGYWIKDEFGNLNYHSLSVKIEDRIVQDEHIWHIQSIDNWIMFQSLHNIYIYNMESEEFNIITSETQLPEVIIVEEHIYFQQLDKGLFRVEKGEVLLVSDDELFKKEILVNIFSVGKEFVLLTQEKGFYFLNNNEVTKWDVPADEKFVSISVYSGIQLKNGNFAIGTISDGVYVLDEFGKVIYEFNQANGLNNNTILDLFEDDVQNLWLGYDNGIGVVNLNSPFSVFTDVNGKLGSVYASIIYRENLYLGTNQGLFYRKLNSNEPFRFIDGTEGQVWCLKIFDDTLFCGHNRGTSIIVDNEANLICDVMGTWDIQTLKSNKNILIQGHYNGLNILKKVEGKWQFSNNIKGFKNSTRFFGLVGENTIYVNHEYKGVFKLRVNMELTEFTENHLEKSVPKSLKSSFTEFNKELLYTSKEGVFKLDRDLMTFKYDSIFSLDLFGDDKYASGKLVANESDRTLWGFTDRNLVYFSTSSLNDVLRVQRIPLPIALSNYVPGYENITKLEDRMYIFGTSSGYVKLDLDLIDTSQKEFEINIYSIEKSVLNHDKTSVALVRESDFDSNENNLFFKYSVPEFDRFSEVQYQYYMEGLYKSWSNWDPTAEVSFENLPFGEYTFRVKARIGNRMANNIASYTFVINRPWYISNRLLLIYGIMFILIVGIIHSVYKRNFNRQKQELIDKKQREFTLSQLENEKMIVELKNAKLKNDIEGKTKELSTSAMNIIKKNDLLNSIKKELSFVRDQNEVKSVIRIINKSLAASDDWEVFEEAFNNADQDFLKRVKAVHPSLTPNDLRLCAYLRLNLSSKEIAPMLNISPRSVEIKRYRLRKKMELPHGKSLVEYMLEF